jgi:hypothetical protein
MLNFGTACLGNTSWVTSLGYFLKTKKLEFLAPYGVLRGLDDSNFNVR